MRIFGQNTIAQKDRALKSQLFKIFARPGFHYDISTSTVVYKKNGVEDAKDISTSNFGKWTNRYFSYFPYSQVYAFAYAYNNES